MQQTGTFRCGVDRGEEDDSESGESQLMDERATGLTLQGARGVDSGGIDWLCACSLAIGVGSCKLLSNSSERLYLKIGVDGSSEQCFAFFIGTGGRAAEDILGNSS